MGILDEGTEIMDEYKGEPALDAGLLAAAQAVEHCEIYGIYPMPIGSKGLAMIDARDIGEIAAIELIRREKSATPLPLERFNLVGPDTLTGANAAAIWSEVLGRTIAYPGDDTAGFEKNLRQFMPSWMAFDMRVMSERFLTEGMVPEAGDVERLTKLLGRPLRSYRDFVSEITATA